MALFKINKGPSANLNIDDNNLITPQRGNRFQFSVSNQTKYLQLWTTNIENLQLTEGTVIHITFPATGRQDDYNVLSIDGGETYHLIYENNNTFFSRESNNENQKLILIYSSQINNQNQIINGTDYGTSGWKINYTSHTVEGYAYFTPDDGKFYIDTASNDTVILGTNRIVLNALKADIQQSFTVTLTESSSFWSVNIPGLTELFDGLIIHISIPVKPNELYNVLNINNLGNKIVYYKFNEPLGNKITAPTELTLIYRTTIASFDYIVTERNEEINYGRSGWVVNSSYSINQADIYYGNLAGNAATATKLFSTPNTKTQFLRGDNIWTNKIIGDIYAENFCGNLNGNANTANTASYLSGTINIPTVTPGTGKIKYSYNIGETENMYMFPIKSDENSIKSDKNGILTINLAEGNYYSQLGFSSNSLLYYRHLNDQQLNSNNSNSRWKIILTMNLNNYKDNFTGQLLKSNGANAEPTWTNVIGSDNQYFNSSYINNMYASKIFLKNIIGYAKDINGTDIMDQPYYGIAKIQANYPYADENNENQEYTYKFPTYGGTFVIASNPSGPGQILVSNDNQTPNWVNTLNVTHGGTGKTNWNQYGILYASASDVLSQTRNTSSEKKFLSMTGDDSTGGIPTWEIPKISITTTSSLYYLVGYTSSSNSTSTLYCRTTAYINSNGYLYASKVYNAVWNDFAEYRQTKDIEYGRVYQENDNGIMTQTNARLIPGCSVASDTFGSAMGETKDAKTTMAVAGRVLVYTYQNKNNYHAGMAVCSAPNGTVDIMTREEIMMYPDCIIGYVSEVPDYEKWGSGDIKVNNRIWIKI